MPYISTAERIGIEKGKIDVALHLLEEGSKVAFIKKVTGLSLAKIKTLRLSLKQKNKHKKH